MNCPDFTVLHRLALGQITGPERDALSTHIAGCTACAVVLDSLSAHDGLQASAALSLERTPHDPWQSLPGAAHHADPATPQHDGKGTSTRAVGVRADLFPFLGPAQAADEIGRLGPYRILKLLGQGGMGVVFQAEDTHLERPVALKVVRPGVDQDPTTKPRFLREARAAAALKSDHVVTVYQVGEENGVPYLAMEFLHGESLEQRLDREPPLTLPEILRIGREVAQGLAAAHERGLIHRDIKPANIWLEAPTSRVKLLDFGLARHESDHINLTQSGHVVGTPAYLAPEQARGEPLDVRCDLFSLGCVLYRCCTGRLPFRGSTTMAILTALAIDTPEPIQQVSAWVPPRLAELVMELLSKRPRHRPESAQAVIDRLRAIEQELSPSPRTPVTPAQAQPAVWAGPHTEHLTPQQGQRETALASPEVPLAMPVDELPVAKSVPPRRGWRTATTAAGVLVVFLAGVLGWISLGNQTNPTRKQAAARTEASRPNGTMSAGPQKKPPVKVFLLAGQSDMVGRGAIRTLDWLGQDPKYGYLLKKIKKADDSWVVRNDVWVFRVHNSEPVNKGPLTVGYGQSANEIGPELLFGHVMADHFKSQVLLIKVTQGDMSLALECRPPSSGGPAAPGPFYKRMRETVSLTLAELKKHFPAYEDQGYELAGFVWFQGWNDMIKPDRRAEYEVNLANLIRDLRKDLGVPQLPVVIGEMGVDGKNADGNIVVFRNLQAAVARRPEFKGTVVLAPTVQYWDMEAEKWYRKGWDLRNNKWTDQDAFEHFDKIATQPGFLYFGSGKIYALLGYGFGEAMKSLCPLPPGS